MIVTQTDMVVFARRAKGPYETETARSLVYEKAELARFTIEEAMVGRESWGREKEGDGCERGDVSNRGRDRELVRS